MKQGGSLRSRLYHIVTGKTRGQVAGMIRLGLILLEPVYYWLSQLKLALTTMKRLPVPVISVGNIVAGGTGKTPTVAWLAGLLLAKGFRPAILTRGYGGSRQREGLVFTDAESAGLTPAEVGDEPYLLAELLPGVPIAVGRDRWQTGLTVLRSYPRTDLFILDDGFQYRRLGRDLDIVVVDALNPFGNEHLIPAGLLREAPEGLKRADLILLTRTDQVSRAEWERTAAAVKSFNPVVPVARAKTATERLIPLFKRDAERGVAATELARKEVGVITGIGNPEQFLASVKKTGMRVAFFQAYPDHHFWEEAEVMAVLEELRRRKLPWLVTTAKDGVKLRGFAAAFAAARITGYTLSLEFSVDDPAALAAIENKLPKKG